MNYKRLKKVLFASAKSVGGAPTRLKNALFIKTLKFRGAFPYPVVLKKLTIFRERRNFKYEI